MPTSEDADFRTRIEGELARVSEAVFGIWKQNGEVKRVVGILERLRRIEHGLLIIGVIVAIKFIGVPTEMIFPLLVQLFTGGAVKTP